MLNHHCMKLRARATLLLLDEVCLRSYPFRQSVPALKEPSTDGHWIAVNALNAAAPYPDAAVNGLALVLRSTGSLQPPFFVNAQNQ